MKAVLCGLGGAALFLLASCSNVATTSSPFTPLAGAEAKQVKTAAAQVLFWSDTQKLENFRKMETLFPGTVARRSNSVKPLEAGKPLTISESDIESYMTANNTVGLLVLQDGKVRLERYAHGYGPDQRWTSFSVAKSFTSTLVGAAVKDGLIRSVDDPVTTYIPELKGSGYDGVTVAQLLAMTSGVKWNEDYTDPNSDVARMYTVAVQPGEDPTVAYMRTLPREAEPGTKWVYKTGETNLVGVLVQRVTGKLLTTYLQEKVWSRIGPDHDLFWMIDEFGKNVGGCCLSTSLRDYAKFGELVRRGGDGVVPANWFSTATSPIASVGAPGFGYGYQWWTYPGNRYGAQGIFGQSITIDPAQRVTIVINSAWPKATGAPYSPARMAFVQKILAATADEK